MQFINAVGSGLFGDDYVALTPRAAVSQQEPIELIDFAVRARSGQHSIRAPSVGERIKSLLTDTAQHVRDRRTEQSRRLRGGRYSRPVSHPFDAGAVCRCVSHSGAQGKAAGAGLVLLARRTACLSGYGLCRQSIGSSCSPVPRCHGTGQPRSARSRATAYPR